MSNSENKIVRYLKRFGAGSMLVSIIVHVVILGSATVWVVSSSTPQRKPSFQGGGSNNSAPEIRHAVKMANTQPNLAALTQRLVVENASSSVTLPDLPMTGSPGAGSLSPGGFSGGPGAGQGAGIGNLKAPIMPLFGFKERPESGALTGILYLIPSDQYKTNQEEVDAFKAWLRKFQRDGWRESTLSTLKKSPLLLYNTQIMIPRVVAKEAPKAFGVPAQEKKARFLIRYRGKVSPPRAGLWRFVGIGDDIMIVRINGQVVLDASHPLLRQGGGSGKAAPKTYSYTADADDLCTVGEWMKLSTWPVDMEVYLSEEPSEGNTNAVLLVEEEGETYVKTSQGVPILPIWSLAPDPKVAGGKLTIPVAYDAPVWNSYK